jgi:hypothetical protein
MAYRRMSYRNGNGIESWQLNRWHQYGSLAWRKANEWRK